MKKQKKLPKRYIRIEPGRTVALMDRTSGQMRGRVKVRGRVKSDGTRVMRVKKNVDIDKDGKPDYFGGTIIGRTKAVRSSKRAKGYIRKL